MKMGGFYQVAQQIAKGVRLIGEREDSYLVSISQKIYWDMGLGSQDMLLLSCGWLFGQPSVNVQT